MACQPDYLLVDIQTQEKPLPLTTTKDSVDTWGDVVSAELVKREPGGRIVAVCRKADLGVNYFHKEIPLGFRVESNLYIVCRLQIQAVTFVCDSQDDLRLELVGAHITVQDLRGEFHLAARPGRGQWSTRVKQVKPDVVNPHNSASV